jgi:hypothetical protein
VCACGEYLNGGAFSGSTVAELESVLICTSALRGEILTCTDRTCPRACKHDAILTTQTDPCMWNAILPIIKSPEGHLCTYRPSCNYPCRP